MVLASCSATDKTNTVRWFEFICKSLQSPVGALYKELDKVTNSNLFLCSSQPAPGPCEISPETNPAVPNLGTGPDRVSREAAVRVLCCGVVAQEAGWSHLRPWSYPAVPTEGVVPVGKLWLLCLRARGALRCWRRSHSFSASCVYQNPLCCGIVQWDRRQRGCSNPLRIVMTFLTVERAADSDLLLLLAMTFM